MNIIITGASKGFGLALAVAFIKNGDSVFIGARKTTPDIDLLLDKNSKVAWHKLDISNEDSVREFTKAAGLHFNGIVDVLINNAGIYGPMGSLETVNIKEWVDAIQTNLIGTVYMCQHTLPYLKKSKLASIINLSGGGATAPMPNLSSYAASKAAVVRFTETLAEELRKDGISVNAVAPGALNTDMLDAILAAGPEKVGKEFYDKSLSQKSSGGTDMSKGTDLCLYLAKNKPVTGKLISAVWDKVETLTDTIDKSDIYTLRRIVPSDRGHA